MNKGKEYTVYYIIKMDGRGYIRHKNVIAPNQKQAYIMVKNDVKKNDGKHAFHTTCKEPVKTDYGLEFDGMTYTRYNEMFDTLW